MLPIHQSAKQNFETKANELLKLLKIIPESTNYNANFFPEIYVSATITPADIRGEISEEEKDYRGKTIERFFRCQNKQIGLIEPDHEKLVELAKSIQRSPSVKEKLSQKFLEDTIFIWLKKSIELKIN